MVVNQIFSSLKLFQIPDEEADFQLREESVSLKCFGGDVLRTQKLKLTTPESSSLERFHENDCLQSFQTETDLELSLGSKNQRPRKD